MATQNANDLKHHQYIAYLPKHLTISYDRIQFSLFHFPMPLASTAHNITLPFEKARIRNLLLWSPHRKITSGCRSDEVSVQFCVCKHE